VRYIWSRITPTSAHFEQAFSEDGGKSWDVNWISDMARLGDAEDATSSGAGTLNAQSGERDFEPLLGRWNYHLKRRLKPLTGSTHCTPLWHGRAQLARRLGLSSAALSDEVPLLNDDVFQTSTRDAGRCRLDHERVDIECINRPRYSLCSGYCESAVAAAEFDGVAAYVATT
jgi:hypothetical protein